MGTRRRLHPGERRNQLLDVGAAMFAERPYDEVLIEEVAERAGVSRALMYRYFASKRDFFAAIFQRDSDARLAATTVDPGRSMAEQVMAGLDAHIDYFVNNTQTALVVNRGALSGDPLIQGILSAELGIVRRRMLDAAGLEGQARATVSLALHGWMLFVRGVCTEWIQVQAISRDDLHEMCMRTLLSALGITDLDG